MNIRPLFAIVVAMSVSAQPAPPAGETTALEELLQTPISTAAKYDQRMSDVAASVTVITAEEIARYGWRTLAEVLSSIRGVYTTYDRAYTYLGVRGIGLPTDYNNRFLVLIDGVEMTESVSGSIGIDTTLAIDMSTVARIEFVRGPGSVLYGTGAMFGVINLITKDEAEQSSVTAGGGSAGLWTGAARVAITGADVRGAVALSWQDREGRDFYFPEFDSPETNHGIVRDRDGDRYRSVLATARWKDVRFLGLHSKRTKGIPTGAWSTTFGSDQEVTDARTLFAIDFTHRLDAGRTLFARVYDDRFDYHGNFPYEGNSFTDRTTTRRTGAELRYVWDLAPGQRLTTGVEYVDHRRSRHEWMDGADLYRIGAPFRTGSAYAQVESQLSRYVTLTAGASYDHSSAAGGQLTPRGALIVKPTSSSTMKLLYGRAFRSPSVYERDYYSVGFLLSSDLRPEEIRTLELVWEQKLTPSVLVTALVFDEDLTDLIQLQMASEVDMQFQNGSHAHAHGFALQIDSRRNDGIWSYASYSHQQAWEHDERMVNSPTAVAKAGVSTPTSRRVYGGLEMQYEGSRCTYAGDETDQVVLTNLNVGGSIRRSFGMSLAIRNLFDVEYGTPGGIEHRQDILQQDGRSFVALLKWTGR